MHKYDKKLNGKEGGCECCLRYRSLVQHHIAGRRYSEDCIWVCVECHAKVHANPEWSYKNNFMRHHNTEGVKKEGSSKSHKAHLEKMRKKYLTTEND